jgi:hypothetical protein
LIYFAFVPLIILFVSIVPYKIEACLKPIQYLRNLIVFFRQVLMDNLRGNVPIRRLPCRKANFHKVIGLCRGSSFAGKLDVILRENTFGGYAKAVI